MYLFVKLYTIISSIQWYTNFISYLHWSGYVVLALVGFLLGYLYQYYELANIFPSLKYGPTLSQAIKLYPVATNFLSKDSIINNGKYITIVGKYYGEEIEVNIPYSSVLRRKMGGIRVILNTNSTKIDITHKPGIPYFLTANQMGGTSIQFIKNGEIIKTFGSKAIPSL